MKQTPLTESIGTNAGAAEARGESFAAECQDLARETATPRAAGHTVSVRIASTGGFADGETFMLDGEKEANAFARRVMAASIRAYGRRDESE